jgi:hypothetical protein
MVVQLVMVMQAEVMPKDGPELVAVAPELLVLVDQVVLLRQVMADKVVHMISQVQCNGMQVVVVEAETAVNEQVTAMRVADEELVRLHSMPITATQHNQLMQ